MNLVLTNSEDARGARWRGTYDHHDITRIRGEFCCDEGHAEPTGALAHASLLEQQILLRQLDDLAEETWGRAVLDEMRKEATS